jgi:hypothetical protein
MTAQDYTTAAALARGWARGLFLRRVSLEKLGRVNASVGIYFACEAGGKLDYVGSAVRRRDAQGVTSRIRNHGFDRRRRWRWFWILPLREDTLRSVVLAIEGQIIDLLDPPSNRMKHVPRHVPAAA